MPFHHTLYTFGKDTGGGGDLQLSLAVHYPRYDCGEVEAETPSKITPTATSSTKPCVAVSEFSNFVLGA